MMAKYLMTCLLAAGMLTTARAGTTMPTQLQEARDRIDTLRLGSYATSRQVEQLASDEAFRDRAWEAIQQMGITRLYVEVYRGGHTVGPEQLIFVRDWLKGRGIEVVGGIATVPGGDVGVRQKGPLGWFNWQNAKTQRDLKQIIRTAAPIFDSFIVDDFLCTGDVSEESNKARGDRSWGVYRRALLTELARSVFVDPARQVNPDITMIVKYPQWHDRFHLFGYDTETFPRIFDLVWVGTETRGRNTQRFGFVQPYEGFINYRWLAGIAGDKIGGAWFDHGDCAEHDFLDQAYTSVLAGARELVFFNLGDVIHGHPDHAKVIAEFEQLADLAGFVRTHPVVGVPAYKPPNSDPAGDMYLMDFLGMLGVPLVPVHKFPTGAPVIFLPAQAAADPDLQDHVDRAMTAGAHLVVTTNLLIAWPPGEALAALLGVERDLGSSPLRASCSVGNGDVAVDLEAPIEVAAGSARDVVCTAQGRTLLLLRTFETPTGSLSLLNTHTYSQADFDAVGEVLLCPRPLGLLSLDGRPLAELRAAFRGLSSRDETLSAEGQSPAVLTGPGGVTYHPFSVSGDAGFVVQNFHDADASVTITIPTGKGAGARFIDRLSGEPVSSRVAESSSRHVLAVPIPARGRVWVQQTRE